mmetsp:Transcript_9052/g.15311  ORF Transcript_9052/g.15311 Transcript_9052/m.15311 type:complete len:262 (+) Transcript_9052:202-987(+)
MMTSSILRIIFTTCVASCSCCCFPMSVSNTKCSFMSLVPIWLQSTPRRGLPSARCLDLMSVTSRMGDRPAFSARAMGMSSNASAKARMAYCSMPGTVSAKADTAREQAISAEPPPYTTRLSLMRLRTTHMASCSDRLASSTIILFPPRISTVTALEKAQSSMTSMRSLVVPKLTSRTDPALPSFSDDSSSKRGTIRPPVAIAISSNSTPPTHRTAGSSFCSNKWFASSSKPHWQMTRLAPLSLQRFTIFWKYSCSRANRRS